MKTSSKLESFERQPKLFFLKKFLPEIALFMLFVFLNLIMGCHYYKVTKAPVSSIDVAAINPSKYVILHQGENAWHFTSLVLDQDKNELSGLIENVSVDHLNYLKTKPERANRYTPAKTNAVSEMHIYISRYVKTGNTGITVPLDAISKIDIYDKDKGATTASFIFGTIGVLIGAMVILLILVALLKSSCPFVYTYHGQSCQFMGEMYGGAIYSSLERDDYMPLPGFMPEKGMYKIKISNELLERQYTNLAELMVVEHPENSHVLIDKNGEVQTITSPQSPLSAVSSLSNDYCKTLMARDSNMYLFNDDNLKPRQQNELTLSFKKPMNSSFGKLVLNAKNSFWLDYMYGKFTELFGTAYNRFAEKQKKVPAEKNNQWSLDQGLMLSVYLETDEGWKFVDYFNMVGPLAARDMVMPVDLSKVKDETVRIKLTCGLMFWELDYAAMDFSKNIPVSVTHLSPASAIDEKGNDVKQLVSATDKKYLCQPEVGNMAILTYPEVKPAKNQSITPFFHSKGYYEAIRNYPNNPDIAFLKTFYEKGAFTEFSRQKYYNLLNNKEFIVKQSKSHQGN